ncbi:hypothetical protein D0N36_16135 [Hymenobacter lapidiphilus]|nr:hypothetical protein D0N36_16135 [Hymenobacter sp. CCM 8763]
MFATLGRGFYTNHGWPGTLAAVGFNRPLSPHSVLSLQPQAGFFRADSQALEPDKKPGEKYAVGLLDIALAVRTSRHPERPALCFAVGPGLTAGSVTTIERYPGQYLNRDGTVTVLTAPQYETVRLFKPTLYWGLGLDATIDRLYVQAGVESRTYQLLPGELLSAHLRLGYRLR